MSAGVYDFTFEQGAVFVRTFIWTDDDGTPVDLDGYTGALHLRHYAQGPLVADWTAFLTIEASAGTIRLAVPATETAGPRGSGRYDLELTPPAGPEETIRFLEGAWTASPEITTGDAA